MKRKFFWLLFLLLLGGLTSGCTVTHVDIEQEQANGLAGELVDGTSFGQTFSVPFDGLYRIDLYTATYARPNTKPVLFVITKGMNDTQALAQVVLQPDQISNSGPTVITFNPISNVAKQPLYFSVSSPGSLPGDAITVYRNDKDVYTGGHMVVDGQTVIGDIAFIAYTQGQFSASTLWKDISIRMEQDTAFFTWYLILIATILFAIVGISLWPWKTEEEE